jgi:hypothetical protein
MSRFAQVYEDPDYEYIDPEEWDAAFPPNRGDDFLAKIQHSVTVPKSSTFVLHKNNEDLSPFATVNS